MGFNTIDQDYQKVSHLLITLNWQSIQTKSIRILWALLFFTLPVTSFPFFPEEFGGKTLVRPLAIYPLLLLLALATLPRLFRRPLPKSLLPLLAFIVISLISSIFAFSVDTEGLFGISMASRTVRNLVTLGLGVAFYCTVILLIENWQDFKFSLQWLYAGFALALLWGSAQVVYVIHYSAPYFRFLNQLQRLVSTRKLFTTRISGLTYEPKWFAEQICFLLLPWLLGSVISKRSVFSWRYKWITVEWLLLIWSTGILIFTYSRTGLVILVGLAVLSFLFARYFVNKSKTIAEQSKPGRRKRLAMETILLVCSLIVGFVIVGSQNPYFSRLWRYWTEAKSRNRTYLEYIAFQQRFVYWQTAFRMYEAQPLLGVGLGNYAFHFDESLPDEFYRLPEIVRQITPAEGRDRLITPKNLIARLLAETGILGLMTFTTFVFAIVGCVLLLYFTPGPEQIFYGVSGLLSIAVFSVVIFSF